MLGEEEKNAALSDKKKRMWVHKCFRSRISEDNTGPCTKTILDHVQRQYWTMYKESAGVEMKFYKYFRISKHQFNYLLQKIEKDLKKKNTIFREAVSPVEKLAIC